MRSKKPSVSTEMASYLTYRNVLVSNSTVNASTLNAGTVQFSTLRVASTVISLGQSTSQTNNFTNGSFTAWASTLSTTASTAGAGLARVQRVTMSQSGQYQLAVQSSVASYSVVKSSDSGVTWQTLTNGANGLPAGSPAYTSVSYSATGQYALAAVNPGGLYVSNNATATPTFTTLTFTPYAYLPFDNSVTDVSGNSNPIATGSPAYVTGQVGNAINLANTMGSTATKYIRGTWSGSNNFTVSGRFNAQSVTAGQYGIIFSALGTGITLYITDTAALVFFIGSSPTSGLGTGSNYITSNTWYSFTIIYQLGSTSSIYINGTLIGSVSNTGAVTNAYARSNQFCLGTYDNALGNAFNGYIDEFRIYNYATIATNFTHTAVSATGQYMLAAASGGGLFQSTNFGQTWTQVNALLNGGVWTSLSQSESGQYALATTSAATIQPNLTGLTSSGTGLTASWSTNGVNWAVSASSVLAADHPASNAFNNEISGAAINRWASPVIYTAATGAYAGSISTTIQGVGAVLGEWIQLSSSVPIVLSSYTVSCGGTISQFPKAYYIIGSNDGTIWYPLQFANITTTPFTTTYSACSTYLQVNVTGTQSLIGGQTGIVATTAYSTSTQAYIHFRMVITNITAPSTLVEINELYFNFVGGLTCTSNYGQTWSNAANPLFADSSAISGNGQYTLGISNQLLPYAYLPLNGSQNDSIGVLTNATNGTGSGAVTFPGTIYKVGTNAALIPNTAGAGSSLSYLNYTVPAALNSPSTLSVSFWIYISANPASGQSCPFGFNNGTTTAGPYFYINTSGMIGYAYYTNTPSASYIVSTTAVTLNAWNHVVGIVSSGLVSLYLNNAFQATATLTGSLSLNGGASITNLFIGCLHTTYGGFAGYIDDVRIYTSAPPPTAIAELYAVPALNPIPLLNLGSNYLMGIGGSSYTPITLSNLNANISGAACSNTGQYMVVVTQGTTNNVYYSTNYGSTWTALTVGSSAMTSCAMSVDGTYITVSNATNVYTLNWNGQGFTVAMGSAAGAVNQASNAIAIGNQAGQTNQTANSIVLNASGAAVNPYTQGFYVAPIQPAISSLARTFPLLGYGSDNQIVQSATSFSNSQQTVYGEWIQYQLATPSPITSYTLYGAAGYPQFNPVSWVIVGSNDGTNWTLLDTQTGTAGWGTYTLTQATASYTYYRMVVTQITSILFSGVYYIDIGAWVLNNGSPIFGPAANYTLTTGSQGYLTVLQLNSITVCTTTFSFTTTSKLGITLNGTTPSGWIPTSDGYTKNSTYFGFIASAVGPAYEYNSSFIAFQGTSTTINTTVLGNTNMSGTLCLMGGSRVGIGSTTPQYALDVAGTAQINGTIPAYGQPDSAAVVPNSTFAQTWNLVSGLSASVGWSGSAVSATGQYMTVCTGGGYIYYSSNYGSTWATATGPVVGSNYVAISMSSTGQYQLTGINTGSLGSTASIYTSSNYGVTWTGAIYSTGNWFRNCISGNGQYQYIVQYISGGGGIWSSSNYGASFAVTAAGAAPAGTVWNSICCSASGQYVSAGLNSGTIYYSSNYGASWTSSGVTNGVWIGMCSSASGQYQTAVSHGGSIWYSNNFGVSWTASNSPTATWVTPSCSVSGQYQIAVSIGYIYYSTNYGISWTNSGSIYGNWQYSGMSQNGLYSISCIAGGGVYLSTLTNIGLITNGTLRIATADNSAGGAAAQTGVFNMMNTSGYGIYATSMSIQSRGNTLDWYSCDYNNGTRTTRPILTMRPEGSVGIGTAVANSGLHVYGPSGYSTSNGLLTLMNSVAGSTVWTCGPNAFGTFVVMYTTTSAGVTLGAGNTSWASTSDKRLKRNINPLPSALESILKLRPITFNYKADENNEVPRTGFVAQEVENVFPNEASWIVTKTTEQQTDEKGDTFNVLTVSMVEMIPYMVKSIQELASQATSSASQIKELSEKVTSHASQTAQLTAENTQLKSAIAAQASAISLLEARLAALEAK